MSGVGGRSAADSPPLDEVLASKIAAAVNRETNDGTRRRWTHLAPVSSLWRAWLKLSTI
jgi:hypothetical protein